MSPPTESDAETDIDAETETATDADATRDATERDATARTTGGSTAPTGEGPGANGPAGSDESSDDWEGEGRRAVPFERAADRLEDVFDVDPRRGETISDVETAEDEEGRQLIATVERSRTTAIRERVRTAARTGRRVGRLAFAFGALAAVAYAVLRERSQSDRSETAAPSDERADISIDESGNATDE